jgi:hypothetical protein
MRAEELRALQAPLTGYWVVYQTLRNPPEIRLSRGPIDSTGR